MNRRQKKWKVAYSVERGNYMVVDAMHVDSRIAEAIERGDAYLMASAPELKKALKLHQKFWDKMPRGQIGKIVCDIGILNQAFLETTAALAQSEGRP